MNALFVEVTFTARNKNLLGHLAFFQRETFYLRTHKKLQAMKRKLSELPKRMPLDLKDEVGP